MSRVLTTDDIKAIFELIEKLTPEWTDYFAADDSEGAEPPKKIPLSALKTLLVPYNGAQNDVNLGAHDITGINAFFDALHLSTTPASIPTDIGAVYWDVDAQTYSVVLPNGVTLQIGEELYVNVARDAVAPNPILDGTPVYTTGESGQRPKVNVARADDTAKIKVTGIATHDIANLGRITSFGLIRGVPLARKPAGETWVAGQYLWLAPTGGMTNVEPTRPTPNVRLGLIVNVTGSASFDMLVYIRPAMGMYDLYDVDGDTPDNHSVLEWDSTVGYFKKTNEPVFIKVTVGELISAFQKLASHTIPGSDDDILRLQNQQVGKPHSILEIRSPDTATTEATLSLHNVASGTNDWVFDLSMHNYSGVMKLVSVLSHFTGTDAGSWEWWSRYTNGTDYDMIERQLMKLDGQTGYLGVGEALTPQARVHVKQSGWVDKPAMMVVMDSSHENYPEGLYVKNDTNFASGGSLVRFKLVNVTDTATLLKLENAGTGAYINADSKFVVDKDGNIESPTIEALKGVGYTEGSLKTHEDRLDTLEGTGAGSVAKAIDDAVSPIDTRVTYLESVRGHLYGVRMQKSSGICIPTYDAIGMTFRPQVDAIGTPSDFSSVYPWRDIKTVKVDADKNILCTIDDASFESTVGDIMVKFPVFWHRYWTDASYEYYEISDTPRDGFFAGGFYNPDMTIRPYALVGAVKTSNDGRIPHSWTDTPFTHSLPLYRTTAGFQLDALNKSSTNKWSNIDHQAYEMVWHMIFVEIGGYKISPNTNVLGFDVKGAIGQGINGMSNSYSASNVCTVATVGANTFIMAKTRSQYFKVGMLVQIGTAHTSQNIAANRYITDISEYDATNDVITVDGASFTTTLTSTIATWAQPLPIAQLMALKNESGYVLQFGANNLSHVCYRGIWDLWGNLYEWMSGLYRYDLQFYACFDWTKMNVNDPRGVAGWVATGIAPNVANGYLKTRQVYKGALGEIGLPAATGAGSSTWYAAYAYYFNDSYMGLRAVLCGGYWADGATVGFFWSGGNPPANSGSSIGGRLIG